MTLRLVIATINTKLCHLGKWITTKLKPTTKKLSTCIKDSDDIIKNIKILGKTHNDECFYTDNALNIFPNIVTTEDLTGLVLSYETKLVTHTLNTPTKKMLKALSPIT